MNERPVLLGPLSGGRSNRSFLLDSGNKKLVLRLNAAGTFLPGDSRRDETGIWQAASHAGIAPPLLYADEGSRFLVSLYIENGLPGKPPYDEEYMRQAIDLLRRCHQLEYDATSINYAGHIDHYWQMIGKKNRLSNPALFEQRGPMQSVLNSLINSDAPMGLCHHYPVVANFIGNNERLYLIDWEYAAKGLLVMDYAAIGVEWEMDFRLLSELTGFRTDALVAAEKIYRYLCDLWQEATTDGANP